MNPGSLGLLDRYENLGGVQRCLSDCEIAPGLSRVRHVFRRIGQKHLFGLLGKTTSGSSRSGLLVRHSCNSVRSSATLQRRRRPHQVFALYRRKFSFACGTA